MKTTLTKLKVATASTAASSLCFCTLIIAIVSLQLPNTSNFAYGQSDSAPFEIGDIVGLDSGLNMTGNDTLPNHSDIAIPNEDTSQEAENCVMPPCPPGHACIQSCPEVS